MTYQVPEHISKDKIFIVKKSEIKGRLDPHYNQPLYIELWDKLLSISAKITTLRESSISIFSGITPKRGGDAYTDNQGIPFVRSGDFSETNEIDFSQLLCIKENIHNTLMANSKLQNGDLLIAIVGATIGKVGVYQYNYEANINQAICAVRLKKNLNPYYVQAFLQTDVGKIIIERTKRPVARANINLEEVGSFPIPLLDSHRQDMIVDIMEFGRKQKRAKEFEAQQLLDSIDGYLLKELGITIPEIETDIGYRMFVVQRSDLKGRYTPSLYKDAISLCSTIYDNIPLSHLAYINPNTRLSYQDKEMLISFVPMESINEIYAEITDNKNCFIAESKGFTRFQEGDLLWAKITPCMENGKSAIAKDLINGYGCGSTELHVIRPKNDNLLVGYIHSLLHMKIVRQTAKLYFGGSAGQQRVATDFLENFNVPLPSYTKQQEIVDYIADIRTRAKALQVEGKVILENAKRKVEQMIMG